GCLKSKMRQLFLFSVLDIGLYTIELYKKEVRKMRVVLFLWDVFYAKRKNISGHFQAITSTSGYAASS
ncbi:hypothetical protein, partial [Pollutibacter soli]|uniref:hypothetical protein n=1 Tax=Pollutibacter soli TaxID=3034157 RepID=UPI003013782D